MPKLDKLSLLVLDKLQDYGYEVARGGWPDILAYRNGCLRFIEVKPKRGKLRASQEQMHALLRKGGIRTEILRISPSGRFLSLTRDGKRVRMYDGAKMCRRRRSKYDVL